MENLLHEVPRSLTTSATQRRLVRWRMFASKIMVAIILLTAPPGTLELNDQAKLLADCGPDLRTLAVQMEILDPQETKFFLTKAEDFAADMNILQGRYQ